MAVAFARMQTVTKSPGRPMLEKIDYIARRGRYAKRGGLIAGPVTVLPPGSHRKYRDERLLWSDAESAERWGYVIAQEVMMALPPSGAMPTTHAKKFCRMLAEDLSREYSVAVTFAIHSDAIEAAAEDGEPAGEEPAGPDAAESNEHVHFLLGSRQLSPTGFARCRHRALLPDIGGRSLSASAVTARVHAVDATDFQALARSALERYFDRTGLAVRLRLPAIHAGQHVGPVAAVRALVNDVEALARRPDADAIFRKIERLRVNSEIEARNVASIRAIEPLLEHLGTRIFTRNDVEELVRRYCPDATDATRVVEAVMARSLCFAGPHSDAGRTFHITPQYKALENRIAQLTADMAGAGAPKTRGGVTSIDTVQVLAGQIQEGQVLSLLDLTDVDHAEALADLSQALMAAGRMVVMATNLNKRRDPPRNVPLRALHWGGDFVLPDAAVVLLDEVDQLALPLLERLLRAAGTARAQIVFCRRSYRGDVVPHPTVSAILADSHVILGGLENTATALAFLTDPERTVQFVDDRSALVRVVPQLHSAALARGRRIFFLCADPLVTQQVEAAAPISKGKLLIGRLVPEDWSGAVVVLHSPLVPAGHLRTIAHLRPHFLVPKTTAADHNALTGQLRYSLGQLTTITDPVRPTGMPPRPGRQSSSAFSAEPGADLWPAHQGHQLIDFRQTESSIAALTSDDHGVDSHASGNEVDDDDPDRDMADPHPSRQQDEDDDDPDPEFSLETEWTEDPDDDPE